ncbi:MAG: hypothetical protein IK018_05980 [Lachnospiraceae bacterium]|nr:hypothetical protein [Lachnospiraceae bacterium]
MRREIAGLLILALVVSSACACGSKKEETKSEPDTEISASVAAEVSASEEDNSETLFADAFARFEEFVQEENYEEAYLAAEEAEKYGNFNKKCLEQFTSQDDDSIIKLAYIYLCMDDPVKAADCVIKRDSENCEVFLQFIRDNSYIITEYHGLNEEMTPYMHYVYDDHGRIIKKEDSVYTTTTEYGKNEQLDNWGEGRYRYRKFDESGKVVYEYENGGTYRYENNYIYDDSGRLIRKEYLLSDNADTYEYDESGNCVIKYEKDGGIRRYEYDEKGREIKCSYEYSQGSINFGENTYDDKDRLVKEIRTYAAGEQDDFNYEYDDLGRKVKEYGTYYWPREGFVDFETVYTFTDINGGYERSTVRSDGEDGHGFRKYDSLGQLVESYEYYLMDSTPPGDVGDAIYPYVPVTTKKPVGQLKPYVSSNKMVYDYTFFIKSKEEDADKNLYQCIAEDVESEKLVTVSDEDAMKYGDLVKIIPEGGPCGDMAIEVERLFIYCYELDTNVDVSAINLVFKNSKKSPDTIKVYATFEGKEKLLGSFNAQKIGLENEPTVAYTDFYPDNAIDIWNYRNNYPEKVVIRPADLKNYSSNDGTIEVDFGSEVENRYGGGAGVIGQDGVFETIKVSDDVVIVGLNNSIYPTFVTKDYLEKYLYGAGYEVIIDHGVIVYIEEIQSV